MKYCISHKTDDGVFWKKIFDDKIHQLCLQGASKEVEAEVEQSPL